MQVSRRSVAGVRLLAASGFEVGVYLVRWLRVGSFPLVSLMNVSEGGRGGVGVWVWVWVWVWGWDVPSREKRKWLG